MARESYVEKVPQLQEQRTEPTTSTPREPGTAPPSAVRVVEREPPARTTASTTQQCGLTPRAPSPLTSLCGVGEDDLIKSVASAADADAALRGRHLRTIGPSAARERRSSRIGTKVVAAAAPPSPYRSRSRVKVETREEEKEREGRRTERGETHEQSHNFFCE